MGGQGWEFSPILAAWLVFGKLPEPALGGWYFVRIFGTVPFGMNPVLTIWW
jgi:hypothetical protein